MEVVAMGVVVGAVAEVVAEGTGVAAAEVLLEEEGEAARDPR